jgi:YidC/Oxa1 family membrane protein insertase
LLVVLYNIFWQDFGLAIIAVTLVTRLILYPSYKHQLESQKRMAALQPKLNEIREKYKDDKNAQSRAMMEFYKENKLNPFSSCLPLIIQLIVILALYRVFILGLNGQVLSDLYSFVPNPGKLNYIFMRFLDLSQPNLYLAVLTGIVQFLQSKMATALQPKPQKQSQGKDDFGTTLSTTMTQQMLYFFPIITVVIGAKLASGLVLYWFVSTLFAILQQYLVMRGKNDVLPLPVK